MAKKMTKKEKEKKNEEKKKKEKERREKEEKKNEEKKEEKRKREKERREEERKKKNKMQKKLNKLNKRKKERIKRLKIELEENNNTIINNNILTINIRTPSPSNSNRTPSPPSSKKPKSESSKSYFDDSSYEDFEVSIPEIPKHPERDDTYKSYTPTALPYENVLLNRDFLRDINKQLKEKNFIRNNKYSFHDFCLYYKLKTYFKTKKEEEKEAYPNILKYLHYIKEYKKLEYENRFLKEYNNKIYCFYKKKPYERTYKKSSSSSSESDHSMYSPEKIIIQKNIREKMGPESERIRQEVDSVIKKIEDKKRRKIEDKKRRKDGKLRRKRKRANKDWIRYIDIKNK